MGLARRVIPTLLADGEKLVKGQRFNPWRTVGHVEQAARICALRAVDELILLDVRATPAGRPPNFDLVYRISEALVTPLTVGGGVRKLEHIQGLLNAGADKVAIGAAALEDPDFVREACTRYGSQAIVVAIDAVGSMVTSHGGRDLWGLLACSYAGVVQALGAGEILLTSVDREGRQVGYDLDLVRAVSQAVDIPVIAHGGAGTYQHMFEAIQAGAHAVAAGAMFQFTDQTPRGAAEYLAAHGIEARIPA